jgi:hypothetical protein
MPHVRCSDLEEVLHRRGAPLAAHGPHGSGAGDGCLFTWVRTVHRPWVVRIRVAPDDTGSTIAQSPEGTRSGERCIESHAEARDIVVSRTRQPGELAAAWATGHRGRRNRT